MSMINDLRHKAEEYGLQIYNDYPIETGNEHVFFIEDMIIFINEEEKSIAVSFQAATRPERAANMVLILNEINAEIDIMESFIFDKNNRYLNGEKAFELVENLKKSEIIQNFLRDQALTNLLMNSTCHQC